MAELDRDDYLVIIQKLKENNKKLKEKNLRLQQINRSLTKDGNKPRSQKAIRSCGIMINLGYVNQDQRKSCSKVIWAHD